MKIDEIKDPQIRALAWKYRKSNKNGIFYRDTIINGFNWEETKEGYRFWNNVDEGKPVEITEKMKADHPEIFKKEEMKTTHTLENGTVLEVGKKYCKPNWDVIKSTEILYLGSEKAFLRTDKGYEYEQYYSQIQELILCGEPREKIFEGYKPYICHNSFADLVKLEFRKLKPLNGIHTFYYTIEEAEEQGLDLSIFNI